MLHLPLIAHTKFCNKNVGRLLSLLAITSLRITYYVIFFKGMRLFQNFSEIAWLVVLARKDPGTTSAFSFLCF